MYPLSAHPGNWQSVRWTRSLRIKPHYSGALILVNHTSTNYLYAQKLLGLLPAGETLFGVWDL
jgi:hypothetical protein